MIAPAIRPADGPALDRAAGLAVTEGGALGHAGLLASQFHKPALVVGATWSRTAAGETELLLDAIDAEETASTIGDCELRTLVRFRRNRARLRHGDPVVLDGDLGLLHLLGREPDVGAICAELGAGDRRDASGLVDRLARLDDPGAVRWAIGALLDAAPKEDDAAFRHAALLAWMGRVDPGSRAREILAQVAADARDRAEGLAATLRDALAGPAGAVEILGLRLDLLHAGSTTARARRLLGELGMPVADHSRGTPGSTLEPLVRRRLRARHDELAADLLDVEVEHPLARHRLARFVELDRVLGPEVRRPAHIDALREGLEVRDASRRRTLSRRAVLGPGDGGEELASWIGGKAAGLGELHRLLGPDAVPPWFVVTDSVFRACLAGIPTAKDLLRELRLSPETPLGDAIESVTGRADLSPENAGAAIRTLWESAAMPDPLARELDESLKHLFPRPPGRDEPGAAGAPPPRVAIRSSTREADTGTAARAGEFGTMLYVSPDATILAALKRAWAGFWSAGAVYNRRVLGVDASAVGGGVIVQRMLYPKASGAIRTAEETGAARGELSIAVGLGVGEGIMAGTVGADVIRVDRASIGGSTPLRFRYVAGDKQTRRVYNEARGRGTIAVTNSFHQRWRPALEYTELGELVDIAARLDAAFGMPLHIEFAIEMGRPWILQVRPVPRAYAALRETLESFPLSARRG